MFRHRVSEMITESLQGVSNLLHVTDFYALRDSLGTRWPGIGIFPKRTGDALEDARILKVCGVLTVILGQHGQTPVQDAGKDMLSLAERLFRDEVEAQECRAWLALGYLHRGENCEAIAYAEALIAERPNTPVVVSAAFTQAIAETELGKYDLALRTLASVENLLNLEPCVVQGKFYLNRGRIYRLLKRTDEAKKDYDQAAVLFEEGNALRWEASAVNNFAGLLTDTNEFLRAHTFAERAVSLFQKLKDRGREAKVWDQIAHIYLKEKNYSQAVRHAAKAVALLSLGDNDGWLAEALITHGIALAQVGLSEAAAQLKRAADLSEKIGNSKQADEAYLELWRASRSARSLAARLADSVKPMEQVAIERTLIKYDGQITPAAAELDIHHNAFKKKLAQFPHLGSLRRKPSRRSKRTPGVRRSKSL